MYIWKWLSKLSSSQKSTILKSNLVNIGYHEIAFLISYMEANIRSSYREDIESIAKRVLKKAEGINHLVLKALAHEALGRIFFEKGMFSVAYAQFEEALKTYLNAINKQDKEKFLRLDETYAKLNAWIGLSSLRAGENKRAAEAFKEAIRVISNIDKDSPLLGELKALLGDAISFISPEEAVQYFEEAHEIMLRHPSPLLISNGMKLFSALVFRMFHNEAANILNDVAENIIACMSNMNASIISSFKRIYNNVMLKALKRIDLSSIGPIIDFLYGIEGVKAIYFLFRSLLKPVFKLKDLEYINQALFTSIKLSSLHFYEEMLERKKRLLDFYDTSGLSAYKLRSLFGYFNKTMKLDTLIQRALSTFRNVLIISLTQLNGSRDYLLAVADFPNKNVTVIERIKISDELMIPTEGVIENIEENAQLIENVLPDELLEVMKDFGEEDLIIISPDGTSHEVPWEITPTGDPKAPYIGVKTNITRVPTLHQMIFWGKSRSYYDKIALLEFSRKRRGLEKMIRNALKKKGYRVFQNVNEGIYIIITENVDLFHYIGEPLKTPDDQPIIKIGSLILLPTDIERLDFSGKLAIIDVPNGLGVIEDEYYYRNLAIAFQMAGFRSVITTRGEIDDSIRKRLAMALYSRENATRISHILLKFRKDLFYQGNERWHNVILYGDPTVMI